VVITRATIDVLRADFTTRLGRAPGAAEEAALIEEAIDEELLYREALALGLDRGDRSVDHWLVQKMEFLTEDPARDRAALVEDARALGLDRNDVVLRRMLVRKMELLGSVATGPPPTDAELAAYLAAHADRYRQPPQVTLTHVFFSRERRGDRTAADAARAAMDLDPEAPPRHGLTATLGDPFPLGHEFPAASAQHLGKLFGPEFADAVMRLAPGRWSAPLRSAYGHHLVFVAAREPATPSPLESVRSQVSLALDAERRGERLRAFIAGLRARYAVRIEGAAAP
jgi:hypothetical protein